MPTEPPYVNRAYWRQLALINGGFDEIRQRFEVAMNGAPDFMSCSVEIRHGSSGDWIEAEGPIWIGRLAQPEAVTDQIRAHIIRAQEYLRPF